MPVDSRKHVKVPLSVGMRNQKLFLCRSFITANIIIATALGSLSSRAEDNAPAPSEVTAPSTALFELIEAAEYSKADKAALKTGLVVAIPAATTNDSIIGHVSKETIDTQIKKSQGDYSATLDLVFAVAQCIEDKTSEFTKGETFQRIPLADRDVVLAYFAEVAAHYRAQALETLFAHHGRTVSIPADITPTVTNAEYRNLLYLAAKASPKKNWVRLTPGQRSHVLKHGDSLASVARLHKVSPQAIIAVNPGLIPTQMRPGQVLVIPSGATVSVTAPVLTKETALSSTR